MHARSRTRDDVVADIKRWIAEDSDRQILVLLDETDNFLAHEAKNNFPHLMHLKGLMEATDRSFKTVFAGLHHVQRMFKAPNSPLAHFGNAICVGPLNSTHEDREAAYRLVMEPMRAAGFRFEDDSAPDEILSYVNHYPSLVQVYGKELLSHLHARKAGGPEDGPHWTIPREMLFGGQGFAAIEAGIRKKFSYTLDLDPRYKLVAYALGHLKWQGRDADVLHHGLRAAQILDVAQEFWPSRLEPLSPSDLGIILDEMFELGILGRIEHDHLPATYCLRTRQVATMLGTQDEIDEELLHLDHLEPDLEYNPSTNRRYLPGDVPPARAKSARHFSPLTDAQISRLLDDRGESGVRIVAGLPTLGLGRVSDALAAHAETLEPRKGRRTVQIVKAESQQQFSNAVRSGPKSAHTLPVVVYAAPAANLDEILVFLDRRVPAVTEGKVRPVLLLDATEDHARNIALRRDAEILRPWGLDMLRTFLELAEETPLDRPHITRALLEHAAGLPDEIVRTVRALHNAEDPLAALAALPRPDTDLLSHLSARMRTAITILAEAQDLAGEDATMLYELADSDVRSATKADLETIGPDLMALGLLDQFSASKKRVRLSALGKHLAGAGRVLQDETPA